MAEACSLVLLGFVDQKIKDENHIEWNTNKIGGEAIFPESIDDHLLLALTNDQLMCPNCDKLCSSICQINCAVDENSHYRVIYVFACPVDDCSYFSVLRLIHHPQFTKSPQSKQRKIWGTDSADWRDDENDSDLYGVANEGDSEEASVSIIENGKFLPKSFSNQRDGTFQSFYIYVENLQDLKHSKSYSSKKLQISYDGDIDDLSLPNEDGEKYENLEVSTIFANDQVSYKFYKSLRDWPEQIIRYSWQGQPLLNKCISIPLVDDCPNCGCKRSFEFQLMPALISQLKSSSSQSLNIDFGTVLIYCCSNNCDNQPFNVEKCIFFEDLDNSVIKGFNSSKH